MSIIRLSTSRKHKFICQFIIFLNILIHIFTLFKMKQESESKATDQVLLDLYCSNLSPLIHLPLLTINWLKQNLMSLIKKNKM
jgi:hypothetical protein